MTHLRSKRFPSTSPRAALGCLVALIALLTAPLGSAEAQSVLPRTPNLSGGWIGTPGTVQFNFLHRFWTVDTDGNDTDDKIVNSPSFLLAFPLPGNLLLGGVYASNSQVTSGEFNEWEIMARWAPLSAAAGDPIDLSVQGAFNGAPDSGDGEVLVGVPLGSRLTVFGVARAFSDAYGTGDADVAFGGGANLRLTDAVALAGDVTSPTDQLDDQEVGWSAGIQVQIPTTPHSFSLQATNTRTTTLQGASVGADRRIWGFEFTIPVTLTRYFGSSGRGDAGTPAVSRTTVSMTDDLRYAPEALEIRVGETVTWVNDTQLIHTVTADPAKAQDAGSVRLPEGAEPFDSGNLGPGERFSHTFQVPGEYIYFCIPHEGAGMIGRVVVSR